MGSGPARLRFEMDGVLYTAAVRNAGREILHNAMQSLFDNRRNNLDAIRLSLAILVIFSHSFPLTRGTNATELLMRATRGQTTAGTIAVDLFFVISGFLITNSFLNSRSVFSYLKKRVYRIYPAFTMSMAVCALVAAPLSFAVSPYTGLGERLKDFFLQTLQLKEFSYLHAFAANPFAGSINGATWTIPYEFWCYLWLAVLGITGVLRRRIVVLILFGLSLSFCFLYALHDWHLANSFSGSSQSWSKMAPPYLAGVVFYLYRNKMPHSNRWAAVAVLVLVASCFVPLSWDVCFPLAGAYLVLWFAFHPRIRLQNFGRFGDFSYGTYLYAFPIQQLIAQSARHSLSPYRMFVMATPLALTAAVLSWWGVEQWFMTRRKRPAAVENVAR